jgi:hypothetical protein
VSAVTDRAAEEARWAQIRERVRADVAAWPPLTERQREELRALFDLRADDDAG